MRLTTTQLKRVDEGECPMCGNELVYQTFGTEKYFCESCDFEIDELEFQCQKD